MKTTSQKCRRYVGGIRGALAAFALMLTPLTALAQQATNGQNGGNGSMFGPAANGANGSDGVLFMSVSSVAGSTYTAGNGGNGGSGNSDLFGNSHSGGGGGNGGNAAVAQAGSTVTVTGGTFTAGSGGNGGFGFGGGGGRGGGGGSALVALASSTVTVRGGTFNFGSNGSTGAGAPGGAGGHAGYDLFANGGAITVYGSGFRDGPVLTGSGTFTGTIGGVIQTLSYSISPAAGSTIILENLGTLATTTRLTVSPSPSVAGQSVTLTAAVTSSGGTPTGSVTFQQGNTLLGTVPLTSGTATLTTHGLPLGSDTLTASYTGDSSFALSNGSFVQTVMPTSTDVVAEFLGDPENVPATSNSGYFGQSFTTITASPVTNIAFSFEAAPYSTASPYALGTAYLLSSPYTGLPSGLSSQTPGFLGVATASGGVYSFGSSVTLLPHTQYFLYENVLFPNDAIYGGGQYAGGKVYYAPRVLGHFTPDPGSNSACFLVTGTSLLPPYATTTRLTSSLNPSVVGQSVTFTAVVTGSPTPTGTIQFAIDGANAGSPVALDSTGQAAVTEAALPPGTHTITAAYRPTSLFLGNAGATLTQTVNPLVTATHLTSSLNPSVVGQSVTFTSTVTSNGGIPTGTVQFAIDGAKVGGPVTLNVSGQATDIEAGLSLGTHTITVAYMPTGLFLGNAGATLTQTVNPVVTQTTLAASPDPSIIGQSVTFTAVITCSTGQTPTGRIRFAIDGAIVGGPVPLDSNGQATDTETALTPGTHSVTAVYLPTGSFPANAFAAVTQTVRAVPALYVSPTGSDADDGSRAHPKRTIQAAVNAALSGNAVILEDGTYTGDGNRDIDFGGRNITVTSQNGPAQTTLDCGGFGNHRGFFFHSGETSAIVSGLTIENGYEDPASYGIGYGGAVSVLSGSTATLANCILARNQSNRGGGVYNDGTITLTGCTLTGNFAGDAGGGLRNDNAATVIGCTFTGNTSIYGGGIYNLYSGTLTLTSCALTANSVSGLGGGMDNGGAAVLTNCTFTDNHADSLGGGLNAGLPATLVNCIFWGDTCPRQPEINGGVTATDCDIQGGDIQDGFVGTGILDADPKFVNAPAGNFHLQPSSPCVGAGTVVSGITTDLDGKPWASPPSIGAYEERAAGHTHLLWTNPSGAASLWTLTPDGTHTISPTYGPYPGWTAKALSDGQDGITHLLWININGTLAVWNTLNGFYQTEHDYGPYSGWTARGLSTGSDGQSHILWNSTDGRVSLWNLNTVSGAHSFVNYGPYPGWTAEAIADGPDGKTRVLWDNADGRMSLWSLDNTVPGGAFTQFTFGPYVGWTAEDVSVSLDNTTHVRWNSRDGRLSLWNYHTQGGTFTQNTYGPYSGWTAEAIADGTDGKTSILWDNADGRLSLWDLDNNAPGGSFTQNTFGPYAGWTASALSNGP